MANISAKDVQALRAETGSGMMDCKRALADAEGDRDKAVELLRERGLAKAGKRREDFEISYSCFVVTGRDEAEFEAARTAAKKRIAFYGSTPAYKGVLDAIGVGELQGELNAMSKQGRWDEMGTLITDEILDAFGVVGEPAEIAPQMLERYGAFTDRTSASFPVSDAAEREAIIASLRAG